MPGAYITVDDAKSLIPLSQGSTSSDALYGDVLKHVLRRIDSKTGQFFYGGEAAATYYVRRLEIHYGGLLLAIPRFEAVDSVEVQYRRAGDWETVDSSEYDLSAEKDKWLGSGVDTIRFRYPHRGRYRIKGNLGWGHPDFDTDPVPEELLLEARVAVRYRSARVGIGGASGMHVGSGELGVEMGGWEFPWTTKALLESFVDSRRLMGGR